MQTAPLSGFKSGPRTGVIYVMTEAARAGWRPDHPDWANLGQGAPETGRLPG
ncbi:MAG: pyridoxal phosphate-dependent aminotransferase, partial [Myxococcota bacterium]|nr:pyridoxal phosphate-dependent aminotransferase [Myxococcota bacterium]